MNRSGFLQRLIGIAGLGFLSIDEVATKQKVYLLQSFVAGFRFHKGMNLLEHLQEQDVVELRREPENKHDGFAVAIYWQQEMIGFLPAASNEIIARLMDAKALPLIGVITHLERNAKPWENVAVAVYFLHPVKEVLPAYLTTVTSPVYSSLKKERKKEKTVPDVFDYYDRVIALNDIEDEAAKAYFSKYYMQYQMQIAGRTFVKVPDDGIYTYLYNVESLGWITADDGKKYLEFIYFA